MVHKLKSDRGAFNFIIRQALEFSGSEILTYQVSESDLGRVSHGLLAKTPGLGGLGSYPCFKGIGVTPGLNPAWSRPIFLAEMRGVGIPFGVTSVPPLCLH